MAYESMSEMFFNAYSILHVPPYHPKNITELNVNRYIPAIFSFHSIAMVITLLPDPPTVG